MLRGTGKGKGKRVQVNGFRVMGIVVDPKAAGTRFFWVYNLTFSSVPSPALAPAFGSLWLIFPVRVPCSIVLKCFEGN